MVITGFIPYLYIFGSAWKAGKRLSAVSGSAITLLALLTGSPGLRHLALRQSA